MFAILIIITEMFVIFFIHVLSLSLSLSLYIYIYIYIHIDVLAIDEIKQALHSLNVPLLSRQEGEYRKVKGGGLWHTSKPMLVF
jgi:hypothetical protein